MSLNKFYFFIKEIATKNSYGESEYEEKLFIGKVDKYYRGEIENDNVCLLKYFKINDLIQHLYVIQNYLFDIGDLYKDEKKYCKGVNPSYKYNNENIFILDNDEALEQIKNKGIIHTLCNQFLNYYEKSISNLNLLENKINSYKTTYLEELLNEAEKTKASLILASNQAKKELSDYESDINQANLELNSILSKDFIKKDELEKIVMIKDKIDENRVNKIKKSMLDNLKNIDTTIAWSFDRYNLAKQKVNIFITNRLPGNKNNINEISEFLDLIKPYYDFVKHEISNCI